MDFKKIIKTRTEQIADSKNQIKELKKILNEDTFKRDKDELIDLIEAKIRLLENIHQENIETLPEELEKIDEKIYKQYYLLRQMEQEKLREKASNPDQWSSFIRDKIKKPAGEIRPIFRKFIDFRMDDKITEAIFSLPNRFIKYPFLYTLIPFIIGGIIFVIYYFFILQYIPNISKENILYYLFIFAISVIILVFIGTIIVLSLWHFSTMNILKSSENRIKLFFHRYPFLIAAILIYCCVSNPQNFVLFLVCVFLALLLEIYLACKWTKNIFEATSNFFVFIIRFLIIIAIYHALTPEKIAIFIIITFVFLVFILVFDLIIPNESRSSMVILITIVITIELFAFFTGFVIRVSGLGSYTPDSLTLDLRAEEIFPDGLINNSDQISIRTASIKLSRPYVLSNIGDDYFIQLKSKPSNQNNQSEKDKKDEKNKQNNQCKQDDKNKQDQECKECKTYNFTIPKSLVLSQEINPKEESSNQNSTASNGENPANGNDTLSNQKNTCGESTSSDSQPPAN